MNLSSNRINQQAPGNPRNARTGRPVPNRAAAQPQQRPPVQQANVLSNYGVATKIKSLYIGQILKGEVSDLRNTEIVVTLENNTIVAGHLQNGAWLAIGETAAFKVVSASQENIVLEALPGKDMTLANSTVQKALEEAGLPKNEKNQLIVMELMKNQMPIHKQSIQHMLQQSFQYKEVEIPTLVLMNKHHIPITTENATQFEHYLNNNHQLAQGLDTLADQLTNYIKELAGGKSAWQINMGEYTQNIPENLSLNSQNPYHANMDMGTLETLSPKEQILQQLFQTKAEQIENSDPNMNTTAQSSAPYNQATVPSADLYNNATTQSVNLYNNAIAPSSSSYNNGSATTNNIQTSAAKIIAAITDGTISEPNYLKPQFPDMPVTFLNEVDKQELVSILEFFDLPEEQRESIFNQTLPLREMIHLIHDNYEKAFSLDQQTSNILSNEGNLSTIPTEFTTSNGEAPTETPDAIVTPDSMLKQGTNPTMLRTSIFDHPVIRQLEQQFTRLQAENKELGGILSFPERNELHEMITDFPIDASVKEEIVLGEIKTSELLRTIKNVLPFTEQEPATKLLQSDTFGTLLKSEFINSFTLTPEMIFKQGGVETYYRKLTKQLSDLDDILDNHLTLKPNGSPEQLLKALPDQAKEQVVQLKNNVDFMKVLNQFFSYVQLPVKLQDKCTHADLYVYTRKKNLAQKQNPIHVLLHLDMDNLGALDIDIYLKERHLTTKFATNDTFTEKLLKNNLNILELSLAEKGYSFSSEVSSSQKPINLIKDFIEPERTGSQSISRYSFDLRA